MSFVGDAIRGIFGFPATGQKGPGDPLPPPAPIAAPPPPPTVASTAGASATAARAAAAAGAAGGTIGSNPQGESASSVTGGKATLSGVA